MACRRARRRPSAPRCCSPSCCSARALVSRGAASPSGRTRARAARSWLCAVPLAGSIGREGVLRVVVEDVCPGWRSPVRDVLVRGRRACHAARGAAALLRDAVRHHVVRRDRCHVVGIAQNCVGKQGVIAWCIHVRAQWGDGERVVSAVCGRGVAGDRPRVSQARVGRGRRGGGFRAFIGSR